MVSSKQSTWSHQGVDFTLTLFERCFSYGHMRVQWAATPDFIPWFVDLFYSKGVTLIHELEREEKICMGEDASHVCVLGFPGQV